VVIEVVVAPFVLSQYSGCQCCAGARLESLVHMHSDISTGYRTTTLTDQSRMPLEEWQKPLNLQAAAGCRWQSTWTAGAALWGSFWSSPVTRRVTGNSVMPMKIGASIRSTRPSFGRH